MKVSKRTYRFIKKITVAILVISCMLTIAMGVVIVGNNDLNIAVPTSDYVITAVSGTIAILSSLFCYANDWLPNPYTDEDCNRKDVSRYV